MDNKAVMPIRLYAMMRKVKDAWDEVSDLADLHELSGTDATREKMVAATDEANRLQQEYYNELNDWREHPEYWDAIDQEEDQLAMSRGIA